MKKLLIVLALGVATLLPAQISVGIRIGAPPAPRAYRVQPRQPGPDFAWIDGYWYPQGRKYKWHQGYWTRMPFQGARWAPPRYEGGMYYQGSWEDDRGRFDHNHKWDRNRNRDWNRRR